MHFLSDSICVTNESPQVYNTVYDRGAIIPFRIGGREILG